MPFVKESQYQGKDRGAKGRAVEKCDMTREQTVRALAGIIQAKPSEASLERMANNDVIVAD